MAILSRTTEILFVDAVPQRYNQRLVGQTVEGTSMIRSLAIVFALWTSYTAVATADDSTTIPLKEIWALGMPETRNVRELPAAHADEQIIESIRVVLKPKSNAKQAARGFAVLGVGDDALRLAHEVLVNGKKALARFPSNKEISIVFFSYQSPYFVHLETVERKGEAIRISYKFIPHQSAETTEHLALIPMGKLPPGKYGVRIEQLPMAKNLTAVGFQDPPRSDVPKLVCQSFQFIVAD